VPLPSAPLELVLADGTRMPLTGDVAIGRAPTSTLQLADPTVSRTHARISPAGDGAVLEDVGSSFGTWLDGERLTGPRPLHDGARIRLGDAELLVERRRDESQAGHTMFVPTAQSFALPAAGAGETASTRFGMRPRMAHGYALKRLEAAEGSRRWVLKDRHGGTFARMGDDEARVLGLIDGRRSLPDLVSESEQRVGPAGPAVLVRLLGDLADRGLLAGPETDPVAADVRGGRLRQALTPRNWAWGGAGEFYARLFRRGGRVLFTAHALAAIAGLAIVGAVVFAYLVAGRYGTPFVVASKFGIGGLVFLLGRFAVAAAHESAHALTMAWFGRSVGEAGLKVVLIFPYVYVDTSDAWFEPRRRRIAVSAAGPISDLAWGGLFSICCLLLPPGAGRDILFQLAFGAYVASFFNLNPLLPRDGYHVLVDWLREPALRERAREQLQRTLSGRGEPSDSTVLTRYSLFSLAWSAVGGCIAVAASLRYKPVFLQLAPPSVVWPAMVIVWVAVFLPALAMVAAPLLERRRARTE
jgi:Zn-dependent protease